MCPPVVLARPHLMLSDSRRNDHVLLSVTLGPIVQRLDDFLRFHQVSLCRVRGSVRERVVGLPLLDLVEPFLAFERLFGEEREELGEGFVDVSRDRNVRVDDLVDVLGLNLEVDDTSSTLSGGSLRSGSKGCSGERGRNGVDQL